MYLISRAIRRKSRTNIEFKKNNQKLIVLKENHSRVRLIKVKFSINNNNDYNLL